MPYWSLSRATSVSHGNSVGAFISKYDRIAEFILSNEYPAYRYRQVLTAIFRKRVGRFRDMEMLPLSLRHELEQHFGKDVMTIQPIASQEVDQTEKVLYQLPDGKRVETVALNFQAGWESFCISSQAGCGFACSFCATGKLGLLRNMTVDEITDQLLDFLLRGKVIDSVAFMGMGEALSNIHLFPALEIMTRPDLFNLSPRRITVSTIGVAPQMSRLAREFPQVNLTLSLHSPFNEQRSEMMPINKKYPIERLMEILDEHVRLTRRKVYIAYILIDRVNDTVEHARSLASLIKARVDGGKLLHVSLIRYNDAAAVSSTFVRSRAARVRRFHEVLTKAGVKSTIRASFGNDIDAACGQLIARYTQNKGKTTTDGSSEGAR